MKNYDHMTDFWKRFWPFLFQQTPALVFMSLVVVAMSREMSNIKYAHREDRLEIRKECATAIAEIRQEMRECKQENDTLRKENVEFQKRVIALETRLRKR